MKTMIALAGAMMLAGTSIPAMAKNDTQHSALKSSAPAACGLSLGGNKSCSPSRDDDDEKRGRGRGHNSHGNGHGNGHNHHGNGHGHGHDGHGTPCSP